MPRLDRIALGKQAENLACGELQRRGYAILARGYRTRMGEIDIVARDGPTIVFVEVKARTSGRFGPPGAAVDGRKQFRLARLALEYLLQRGWLDRPCRFDVVGILLPPGGRPALEVFSGAFDLSGRW